MKIITFLLLSVIFNTCYSAEVNIYTARHYEADKTLYKTFTENTGIKVNYISGKAKALENRIIEEGKDSKADIYFVADAGTLSSIESKGFLQKINSEIIMSKIPENFRTDSWFGITKRARIIYYNQKDYSFEELKNLSYEDLASEKWAKKILIRQSNNIYNQSLVASLIDNNGIDATKSWAKDLVKNFARPPKGNDRSQILSVASGNGNLAIANTYYYALMLSGQKGNEQKNAAKKVKPLFPNQKNRGTHMNISGVGVLKFAPNKENAVKFIEFLLSKEAQSHIANNTFEYPMVEGVEPHPIIKNMGIKFKQDLTTNISSYGAHQSEALKIMTESGWD